jgi:hypothetical protein
MGRVENRPFGLPSLISKVEDWRAHRLGHVSNPRHVKRSVRISRTTLTPLTSSERLCDLSTGSTFKPDNIEFYNH